MTILSKNDKLILKELEGNELYYKEDLCLVEFPYIIRAGNKKKLSASGWKALIKEYFHSPNNDGYWIMKDL